MTHPSRRHLLHIWVQLDGGDGTPHSCDVCDVASERCSLIVAQLHYGPRGASTDTTLPAAAAAAASAAATAAVLSTEND